MNPCQTCKKMREYIYVMQIIDRIIPDISNARSIIQRPNKYIEPIDPGWINRISPLDKQTIDKLINYNGDRNNITKIPESFLEFISKAGKSDGGLFDNLGTFSIKSAFIDEFVDSNSHIDYFPFLINEINYEYIFDYDIDNGEKIYLLTDEDENYEHLISDSFEKFVFQTAIDKYERNYLKYVINFHTKYPTADPINNLIDDYHLEVAWFSDTKNIYAYSNDMTLAFSSKVSSYTGNIYLKNRSDVDKVVRGLEDNLNIEI